MPGWRSYVRYARATATCFSRCGRPSRSAPRSARCAASCARSSGSTRRPERQLARAVALGSHLLEQLPHRGDALRPEALLPLALDLAEDIDRGLPRLAAALGELDELGAAVLRVGRALDVPALLEVGDHLAHRLRRQPRALRGVGEPGAVRVDETKPAPVALADRGMAGLVEARVEGGEARVR